MLPARGPTTRTLAPYRCPVKSPEADGPTRRALVLGDLVLDVVLAGSGPLRRGTDVVGTVTFRQGGSAATTARWLARLGVATTFVTAVGRDGPGRALVGYMRSCGVDVRAVELPGARTGRLGVLVEPDGDRSFVADRGAILGLTARHVRAAWCRRIDLVHVPIYSLVGDALAEATMRAVGLARGRASDVLVSVDLASAGFLASEGMDLLLGRVAALRPDVLLATRSEAAALGEDGARRLLGIAPFVVVKQGAEGASVLRPNRSILVVPARRARVTDTTGGGDAFDAGFLGAWLLAGDPRGATDRQLRAALSAGHRAAARELLGPRVELSPAGLVVDPVRPPRRP